MGGDAIAFARKGAWSKCICKLKFIPTDVQDSIHDSSVMYEVSPERFHTHSSLKLNSFFSIVKMRPWNRSIQSEANHGFSRCNSSLYLNTSIGTVILTSLRKETCFTPCKCASLCHWFGWGLTYACRFQMTFANRAIKIKSDGPYK